MATAYLTINQVKMVLGAIPNSLRFNADGYVYDPTGVITEDKVGVIQVSSYDEVGNVTAWNIEGGNTQNNDQYQLSVNDKNQILVKMNESVTTDNFTFNIVIVNSRNEKLSIPVTQDKGEITLSDIGIIETGNKKVSTKTSIDIGNTPGIMRVGIRSSYSDLLFNVTSDYAADMQFTVEDTQFSEDDSFPNTLVISWPRPSFNIGSNGVTQFTKSNISVKILPNTSATSNVSASLQFNQTASPALESLLTNSFGARLVTSDPSKVSPANGYLTITPESGSINQGGGSTEFTINCSNNIVVEHILFDWVDEDGKSCSSNFTFKQNGNRVTIYASANTQSSVQTGRLRIYYNPTPFTVVKANVNIDIKAQGTKGVENFRVTLPDVSNLDNWPTDGSVWFFPESLPNSSLIGMTMDDFMSIQDRYTITDPSKFPEYFTTGDFTINSEIGFPINLTYKVSVTDAKGIFESDYTSLEDIPNDLWVDAVIATTPIKKDVHKEYGPIYDNLDSEEVDPTISGWGNIEENNAVDNIINNDNQYAFPEYTYLIIPKQEFPK